MKKKLNKARSHLLEWKNNKSKHRLIDIVKIAFEYDVEVIDDIFTILYKLKIDDGVFNTFIIDVAEIAALNGDVEIIDKMLLLNDNDQFDHKVMAHNAAESGNKEVVDYMISNNLSEWDMMALGAAKAGDKKLLTYFIHRGAHSYEDIAYSAALGGHRDLIFFILDNKTIIIEWYELACAAARGGHLELVEELIGVAHNRINKIASAAAEGGHTTLLKKLIVMGANNWNEIASSAASGGHLNIIRDIVGKKITNHDDIEYNAAINGHLNIVSYMYDLGVKPSIFVLLSNIDYVVGEYYYNY